MDSGIIAPWSADWAWGLPLIAATVVIHAFGLGVLYERLSLFLKARKEPMISRGLSAVIVGSTALYATVLHGLETSLWAASFLWLGAAPDGKTAMLYSLGAMTTYGHADIHLDLHWQLMGTLEALNGWILFGLTTALLFSVMQKVSPRFDPGT
ncbi:MAG TPA: hypothetical protein VKH63_18025 [Candidatus Acidoferrum sp.]|jgi:hypothetical protein|nr:hypothetical protein [Candidatus Acidoferrum sp.]